MNADFNVGHIPGRKRKALIQKVAPNGFVVLAYFVNDEAAEAFMAAFRHGAIVMPSGGPADEAAA